MIALQPPPPVAAPVTTERPQARGKFLFAGGDKLLVRGVTYGAFRPRANGEEYPEPAVVDQDFGAMAANGVNAVRTYTVPPRWLLDAALRHGLRVMVGLAAELYVGYLADRAGAPDVAGLVREKVAACAGHPALLCYAVGNEIPSGIVRWHGRRRVEQFLESLCRAAKAADPGALVTYVNYPSTEYLRLPLLDLVCFNVYLESRERLEAYLARLQNLAGDRPLILAEIGLDSRRHGEEAQAAALDWQVRAAFAGGCAGAFVYAWTDEWYTSGADVLDWDFGLTTRDRRPKPALAAVRRAFAELPFPPDLPWPMISVLVCSYNGARTIGDCLAGLAQLRYPRYEVIVVDDGSTDATAAIAREHGVRLISTPNRGLSAARNAALAAASGEIVAYLDDDARPDPDWLTYLAAGYLASAHAAMGGPNIPPPGDGPIADCVANAPGRPLHVLLSDREAEHLPGVNLSARKACLEAVGGFDPRFRVAGDDVDLCWRLRDRGWTIGFHPAAAVWHHSRNSLRTYWRQQVGYGKAEALLERKWPARFNAAGHLPWRGRVYARGLPRALASRGGRVYGGVWGSAPFQSLYEPAADGWRALPLLPEWYLIIAGLAGLALLGLSWPPLLLAVPLLLLAIAALVATAATGAAAAAFPTPPAGRGDEIRLRALTLALHLGQPLARLWGRLRHGLSPWRRRGPRALLLPRRRTVAVWTERWRDRDDRLRALRDELLAGGAVVRVGGDFDPWDLEIRGGLLGAARTLLAIEEHGQGRQLVRFRWWPMIATRPLLGAVVLALLAAFAAADGAGIAATALAVGAAAIATRATWEAGMAVAAVRRGLPAAGLEGRR